MVDEGSRECYVQVFVGALGGIIWKWFAKIPVLALPKKRVGSV